MDALILVSLVLLAFLGGLAIWDHVSRRKKRR